MTALRLPFFVYGTLLPGRSGHDRFLRGRTTEERPAVLPGALLYEGPGYPYAIDGDGTVHGTLVTAAPELYGDVLALLDELEVFIAPGHPRNLYERVVREAVPAGQGPSASGSTSRRTRSSARCVAAGTHRKGGGSPFLASVHE